jgi:hypothetical protein
VKGIPNLAPEPHFKLTEAQRRAVSPRYNVDALEVLLAHLTPEERAEFLAAASDLSVGEIAMAFPQLRDKLQPPVSPSGRRAVILPRLDDFSFKHPKLQRLLDAACRRDLKM